MSFSLLFFLSFVQSSIFATILFIQHNQFFVLFFQYRYLFQKESLQGSFMLGEKGECRKISYAYPLTHTVLFLLRMYM